MASPYVQLLAQALKTGQGPVPKTNSMFMGAPPPQPTMPNPIAAQGALGNALQQQQAQRQAASQAGSALAHKSHPQTLPQAGGQPTQQQAPKPAQSPSSAFDSQINALQRQQAANLANQQTAVDQYKQAMAVASPDAPQYTAPQMQQASPGLALGAALSALLAPKVSQGAIGALGVDQTNREDAYKRDTQSAQDQYKAQSDQFNALTDKRQKGIDNAEKLANLDDRLVTSGNTQLDSLEGRKVNAQLAESREDEIRRENAQRDHARDVRQKQFLMTYEQRQDHYNTLATEVGEKIGLDSQRVDIARGMLSLGNSRLQADLSKFNVSQDTINRLATMRTGAALAMQTDRDVQRDKGEAFRAAQSGLHDINNLIGQLAVHGQGPQAAAVAQRLAQYVQSPQGQRLNAALQQFGVNGSLAGDLLDEETNVDQSVTQTAPTDGTAAPALPLQDYTGGAQATGGSELTPQQMYEKITGSAPQTAPEHVGAGGQIVHTPQAPHADADVQQLQKDTSAISSVWQQQLKAHGGNKDAAWQAMVPGFAGSNPRYVSLARRMLFSQGGGQPHPGNGRAPQRGTQPPATLNQALQASGISPALLPQ